MKYMYAVYGLDDTKKNVEVFIGYIPESFFESFTDSSKWDVAVVKAEDGSEKIGRLFGRAFFVHVSNLKADLITIVEYMGEDAEGLLGKRDD